MNDLAEKALQGLDVARKQVRDHPMLCLAGVGLAVSVVVVLAGGRVGAARSTRSLTTWLGIEDAHGVRPDDPVPGAVLLAAVVALVLVWLLTVEIVRRTRPPETRVWWVAAAWATPFALGPPLMDTTVYSYVARGLLQRHGLDPYTTPPTKLGDAHIVAAIDPGARGTPSADGPLGALLQHLAVSVSGGSALGAVIVLRGVGILAVIAIGRLVADMGGSRRSEALSLCVLNPLVLLYLVSAPHLVGPMVAFVLAALVAANQRRWLRAVALACVAGSISAQGFVVIPIIIAVHLLGRRTVPVWRVVGRDVLVAAGTIAVAGLIQLNGFGWAWQVSEQFSAHPPFSVSSGIANILSPIVRGASFDDLAAGGRITVLSAATFVVAYLVATAGHRPLERSAGYALLALGLLAPILEPWYVLWGALCLAPMAMGARRIWVLTLCASACVLSPPGFSERVSNVLTTAGLLLALAAVVTVLYIRSRREVVRRPDPVSAGS